MNHVATIHSDDVDPSDPEFENEVLNGKIIGVEMKLYDVMVHIDFAQSKTQAKTLIKQGSVKIGNNKEKITDENATVIFIYRDKNAQV